MGILDCFFKKSEMTIAVERLQKALEVQRAMTEMIRQGTIGEEEVEAEEEAERERQRLYSWDDW